MKRRLAYCLIAALLLSGCNPTPGGTESRKVYYVVKGYNGSVVQSVEASLPDGSHERQLTQLLSEMTQTPSDDSLRSPLPAEVGITEVTVSDGCAYILLSEEWETVQPLSRTVAEYCLLLTAIQFESINAIQWQTQSGKKSELLREDNFINEPLKIVSAQQDIKLYFASVDHTVLVPEIRPVVLRESESIEWYQYIVQGLIAGPADSNARSVMPAGTRLLSVSMAMDGRTCIVNLSDEFISAADTASARMTLLALVTSLTELDNVSFVHIRVEGDEGKDYFGFDLSLPLEREPLLQAAGFGELYYTLYYPSSYHDSYIAINTVLPDNSEKDLSLLALEQLLKQPAPMGIPDVGLNALSLAAYQPPGAGHIVTLGEDTAALLASGEVDERAFQAIALTLTGQAAGRVTVQTESEILYEYEAPINNP